MKELEADVSVVTETWLRDNDLDDLERKLKLGEGLGLLALNRRPNDNGVCYGGVALAWRESRGTFKKLNIKNPNRFEVLAAVGSIRGQSRKIVIVACYLPPSYNKTRGTAALEHIEDVIIEAKRIYNDPYVVVTGDFNQWRVCLLYTSPSPRDRQKSRMPSSA